MFSFSEQASSVLGVVEAAGKVPLWAHGEEAASTEMGRSAGHFGNGSLKTSPSQHGGFCAHVP